MKLILPSLHSFCHISCPPKSGWMLLWFQILLFVAASAKPSQPSIEVILRPGSPTADTLSFSPDTTDAIIRICANDTVRLEAFSSGLGTLTFQWQSFNGFNLGEPGRIYEGLLPDGIYNVRITDDADGQSIVSNTRISTCITTATPLITIETNGFSSICDQPGSPPLILVAKAVNPDNSFSCFQPDRGFRYQWLFAGDTIVGAQDDTLILSNSASIGSYSVLVANACGSAVSPPLEVDLVSNPPPDFTIKSSTDNDVLCPGGTLILQAELNGAGSVDIYQWFLNGNPINNANTESLTINQTGTYRLELSNSCGSRDNSLLIRNTPPPTTVQIDSFRVDCDSLIIGATQVSPAAARADVQRYEWYHEGELIQSFDAPFEPSQPISTPATESGFYFLRAIHPCGLTDSDSILLEIEKAPTFANIIPEAAPSLAPSCSPPVSLVPLRAESDGEAISYQWMFSVGGSFAPPDSTIVGSDSRIDADQAGFYQLTVSNNCGVISSDVFEISIVEDISSNNLSVDSFDPNPSCAGAIQLNTQSLGDGVIYIWRSENTLDTTLVNSFQATQSGNYTVQALNACGSTPISTSFGATIEEAPGGLVVSTDRPELICSSSGLREQAVLSAQLSSGSNLAYDWLRVSAGQIESVGDQSQLTVSESGDYILRVFNTCATLISDTIRHRFEVPPLESELRILVDPCSKTDTVILRAFTNATNATYGWFRNGSLIITTNEPVLEVTQPGNYRVSVSNDCNTTGVLSPGVNVEIGRTLATPAIEPEGIDRICPGTSLLLEANFTNPGFNVGYQWFRNGSAIPNAQDQTLEVNQSGLYQVQVFDQNNPTCSKLSSPYSLFVRPEPLLLINVRGSTNFCEGDSVVLKANPTIFTPNLVWRRLSDQQLLSQVDSVTIKQEGLYQLEATYNEGVPGFPCDFVAVQRIQLEALPVSTPEIVVQNGVLTVANNSDNYQWFLNGVPILDANEMNYFPLDSGFYAVSILNGNGCNATSEEVFSLGTYLEETETLRISPNPNVGSFKVSIVSEAEATVSIVNSVGQLILEQQILPKANSIAGFGEIRVANLPPGLYFLRASVDGNWLNRKILVE